MPYHTMQPGAQPARAPGWRGPPQAGDRLIGQGIGPAMDGMNPALIEQLMEVMRRSRMGGQRSPGAVQSQMMNTMGRGPAVESQMMNTMGRAPGDRPVARQIGGRPSGVDPAALMEMMRGTMGGMRKPAPDTSTLQYRTPPTPRQVEAMMRGTMGGMRKPAPDTSTLRRR